MQYLFGFDLFFFFISVGHCRKRRFIAILDQHCADENAKLDGDGDGVKSEYDFLYVPIDFGYYYLCCLVPLPNTSSFPYNHATTFQLGFLIVSDLNI